MEDVDIVWPFMFHKRPPSFIGRTDLGPSWRFGRQLSRPEHCLDRSAPTIRLVNMSGIGTGWDTYTRG
jgi:hypothetical protein